MKCYEQAMNVDSIVMCKLVNKKAMENPAFIVIFVKALSLASSFL